MKKLISLFILLTSVVVFAEEPVTYHLQIKNWPERKKIESQIKAMVDSKACYDINGSQVTPEVDCHKFAWFKSNEVLKPFKQTPTDIKMEIGYSAGKMTVMMYKWDGKKVQRILNSSGKFDVNDIKTELINWSFK
ncbi:hypothetical protein [Pseudobdellovibrio sp. HCB154]|uniref:hypothetical protein n=1 Tax=Pseudobdellovibrio sp. HCB154 TaxID=3386277 RepID=UPI00391736FC